MANLAKAKPTKDNIIAYINATLVERKTKKSAYLEHINPDIKQVHLAIARLEKTEEYQAIYGIIMSDDQMQLQAKAVTVQRKYVELIEKNLDTASEVLDEVRGAKGKDALKNRAQAIRLINETVGAMAVVTGPTQSQPPGKLNKSGAII